MPNCFTLTRRSAPKAGPVKFTVIDEEMCRHFAVPCDSVKWYEGWYDYIGFALACGKTFAQIRQAAEEDVERFGGASDPGYIRWVEIIDWLAEHFTSDVWAEIGRR